MSQATNSVGDNCLKDPVHMTRRSMTSSTSSSATQTGTGESLILKETCPLRGFICNGQVSFKIKLSAVPVWVAEDDVLEVIERRVIWTGSFKQLSPTEFVAWLISREDHRTRTPVFCRRHDRHSGLNLRFREALRTIAAFAFENPWIKMALRGVFNETVFDSI